jgi:ATP-binding cassette, subfamily C, bacterial
VSGKRCRLRRIANGLPWCGVAELILPNIAVSIRLQSELAISEVGYCPAQREIPVLSGVSFVIKYGSIVAMTGQSGAGKSTLGALVAGLIEPTTGKIYLDGIQLVGLARQQWRRSIAYVEYEILLFNDSVRANLLWASPDANNGELAAALKTASANFAFALSAGLNSMVGDGGTRLSGGERQRLG